MMKKVKNPPEGDEPEQDLQGDEPGDSRSES